MKGYKVIREENGLYYSVIVLSKGRKQYKIGEWTEPNEDCGPLCLFKKISYAREFAMDTRGEIFLAEFEKSNLIEVWEEDDYCFIASLPNGTVLAKRIKLLEKV